MRTYRGILFSRKFEFFFRLPSALKCFEFVAKLSHRPVLQFVKIFFDFEKKEKYLEDDIRIPT